MSSPKIPLKKLKSGFSMPVFGLGTWQMGGRHSPDYDLDKQDILAIKTAIEMGITHIDTAEMYALGHAEELVAVATKEIDRKKLFIVSKVSPQHLSFEDLINSCKNSLKNLQTDYLDVYLIHYPNHFIPITKTMKGMDFLKKEGLIKEIGVSNFSTGSFIEAQKATENRIVTNQVHYSLLSREPETSGLLKYCQENDVLLTAYRPVGKGILSTNQFHILNQVAEKYHKTPAQIAINWLTSQKNVVVLAKSSNLDHLKEDLGAVGWEMEQGDVEKLRKEFPNQEGISSVNSLS